MKTRIETTDFERPDIRTTDELYADLLATDHIAADRLARQLMLRAGFGDYPSGAQPHEVDTLIADSIQLGPFAVDHHYENLASGVGDPLKYYSAYVFATVLWDLCREYGTVPSSIVDSSRFQQELFGVFSQCSPAHAPPF